MLSARCRIRRRCGSGERPVRLVMDVSRNGDQFTGSIRRSDHESPAEFWGVLELLAILDKLVPYGHTPAAPPADAVGPEEDR